MSIGVLHKREGDELRVYEIRRHGPLVKEPSGPRGRTPPLTGDTLLVGHFDRGNMNRVGGYFNPLVKSPSQSSVTLGKAPDGTPALIFSYRNELPGFAGFWTQLFRAKEPPATRIFLDATPFRYLTFSIRGARGGEELLFQVADRVWEKKGDSLVVGAVGSFLPDGRVEQKWQRAWIPLRKFPAGVDRKELANLVFRVKGNASGEVFVKDLAFTTKRGAQIPRARVARARVRSVDNRAMWLWETERILGSPRAQRQLVAFCKARGMTDLFLQIPYQAKQRNGKWEVLWDPAKLRPLIARLRQAGVRVHALDGDPRYALRKWHGRVLAVIRRLIEYNRGSSPQQRVYGVRLDIEPYLLPYFAGVQKEAILRQYLSLLEASRALTRHADLALGVDIPFWFDSRSEFFELAAAVGDRPMSELIIDIVDNIGIMDYRTQAYGADGVIAHAADELEYAAKRGKEVFVGLETVELPDETILRFSPASGTGSRILVEAMGSKRVRLYWIPEGKWESLDEDLQSSPGAVILGETYATHVPSGKLTFAEMGRSDLEEVMREAGSEFRRATSFRGFAIHSYESYRPWLGRQPKRR